MAAGLKACKFNAVGGRFAPRCTQALRALSALEAGRPDEAEVFLRAAADVELLDRAWHRLLNGLIALERTRLSDASRWLHEAASWASLAAELAERRDKPRVDNESAECLGAASVGAETGTARRLVSMAWHYLGRSMRRQELLEEARALHLAAWRLREECGVEIERWETAMELALDADLAGDVEHALNWCRKAIDAVSTQSEEFGPCVAESYTRMASIGARAGRFDDAVAAAKRASDWYESHDRGSLAAGLAAAQLGHVLVQYGEHLLDGATAASRDVKNESSAITCDSSGGRDHRPADSSGTDLFDAGTVLRQAEAQLSAARDVLLPFGPPAADAVRDCTDQLAFISRLQTLTDRG